jgi:hypothetical protein
MTCREFERKFNELLDGKGEREAAARACATCASAAQPDVVDIERVLNDHAARCPACREVAARYQILRRALHAWNSPPVARADLADRILLANAAVPARSAWAVLGTHGRKRLGPVMLPWFSLAAASVLAIVVAKALIVRQGHNPPMPPVASGAGESDPYSVEGSPGVRLAGANALNDALAEATRATWDLARSASEPAARISRRMLDAATEPEPSAGDPAIPGRAADVGVTMPMLTSLAPDPSAARAVLQGVGERLASGVGPLSRTARHAFGFLLGPPPAKLERRIISPNAKGA